MVVDDVVQLALEGRARTGGRVVIARRWVELSGGILRRAANNRYEYEEDESTQLSRGNFNRSAQGRTLVLINYWVESPIFVAREEKHKQLAHLVKRRKAGETAT